MNGKGNFIGLSNSVNGGELKYGDPIPDSITYQIVQVESNLMTLAIEAESGVWWTYNLQRTTPPELWGRWKLDGDGAAGVGPAMGSREWWTASGEEWACLYDDIYQFLPTGSFQQYFGSTTFVEAWLGGGDECAQPVEPFDGSSPARFSYKSEPWQSYAQLSITGRGAHIGLPKLSNNGELSSASDANEVIVYEVLELEKTS